MKVVKLETNHQYSFVSQDLATPWLQSYLCKTETAQEGNSRKFLEPSEKPKVIDTDNSYCGITELQHLIDPSRTVLLKERYAE